MIEMRRQSEERFRRSFNSSNDAIMVHPLSVDITPGLFVELNDLACERMGYTRAEFLQLTLLNLSPIDKRPDVISQLATLRANYRLVLERVPLTKAGNPSPWKSALT